MGSRWVVPIEISGIALFFPIRCRYDRGRGRNGVTNHGRWTDVFNLYAIGRSLKNNDQKDIPLDDRDWSKARDSFIVRRCVRAGACHMSRIPGWTGPRTVSALLPNRERGGAQYDEGETDGAASRDFFVECQARK